MKLYKFPYYLILMLASSLAMIFFVKINKKSFYNHYFKGIVDIELRNSQEVDLYSTIEIFALSDNLKPALLSLFWLGISVLLGILVGYILLPILEPAPLAQHVEVSFYKLAFATRAP